MCVCVCMLACIQSLLLATSYKKEAVIMNQRYFASLVGREVLMLDKYL